MCARYFFPEVVSGVPPQGMKGVAGSRNEGEEQETRRDKFQRIFSLKH